SHNHISPEDPARIIESADMLGIEKIAISVPDGDTPEEFRASNNKVLAAMKRYPGRFLGQCFINPGFPRESQEEITRCIGEGMVQVGELYTQYRINEPVFYPIVERCIDLKIPLLMHALAILGLIREGYPVFQSENTSIADDFVEIGNRYPEAMIVHGHIFGGGDWEYTCKTLRDVPSIYGGTCGSQADEGMVDFGLKYLGEDRMIFGTDVNFETGVGKVLSANLTERQRQKIFFGNYNNMLRKAGNHVD
ncbi:amidohydrolase family protein, partial [Candidatus Latescibacterota bacterium]